MLSNPPKGSGEICDFQSNKYRARLAFVCYWKPIILTRNTAGRVAFANFKRQIGHWPQVHEELPFEDSICGVSIQHSRRALDVASRRNRLGHSLLSFTTI
jgi:hypothetical protein